MKRAGFGRRQVIDFDPANPPFFKGEVERRIGSEKKGRGIAEQRLVTHEQEMLVILKLRESRNELIHGTLGRKAGDRFEAGFHIQSLGDNFRCLPRSNKRASQNRIKGNVQTAKPCGRFAHSIDAFGGQRSLTAGSNSRLPDRGGNRMAQKIDIHLMARSGLPSASASPSISL